MTTEANALLNLKTAAKNVRGRMGLSDVPADWTYEQRIAYNKALAAEIQQYPASFTPEIMTTAATVAGKNYTPLEDTSLAWGEFAAEAGLNFGKYAAFAGLVFVAVAAVAFVLVGLGEFKKGAAK